MGIEEGYKSVYSIDFYKTHTVAHCITVSMQSIEIE